MLQLKEGPEIIALRDALMDAISVFSLEALMRRLDASPNAIRMLGVPPMVTYLDIVDYFERRGRVDALVLVARAENPTNPALHAFARRYGLTTLIDRNYADQGGLEALIRGHLGARDARHWFARGAAVGNCVCRIERDGRPTGSGFLVGPGVVLTNHHVVAPEIESGDPARLAFRFDFMLGQDGQPEAAGAPIRPAAAGWLVDSSPHHPSDDPSRHPDQPANPPAPPDVTADFLDYALVRLAEPAGEQAVRPGERRGWLRLSGDSFPFADEPPLLLFHFPLGGQLGFSIDTDSYAMSNPSGTRIYHKSNTEKGSSGSPCLDLDFNLVALHQGDATIAHKPLNRAVPAAAIYDRLAGKGRLGDLGA